MLSYLLKFFQLTFIAMLTEMLFFSIDAFLIFIMIEDCLKMVLDLFKIKYLNN